MFIHIPKKPIEIETYSDKLESIESEIDFFKLIAHDNYDKSYS